VRNLGVSGRTLALEISDWSGGKYGNNVIDGSYARVIYFLGSNTNDLAATSFASTAAAQAAMDTTYANMMTHVATVKAGRGLRIVGSYRPRCDLDGIGDIKLARRRRRESRHRSQVRQEVRCHRSRCLNIVRDLCDCIRWRLCACPMAKHATPHGMATNAVDL
jgi:hypothetical protein